LHSESQEDSGDNDSLTKESQEKDVTPSIPSGSVKDRISAYAGVHNSSRSLNVKKPANYKPYGTPRKYPPKINIYEEARRLKPTSMDGDEDDMGTSLSPAPSSIPPSPAAAAAAADAAAEFLYRRSSVSSIKSAKSLGRTPKSTTPKASSGISGGYLAAIKSPPSANKPVAPTATDAPMVEISATDGNGDGNSVAASSVSVNVRTAQTICQDLPRRLRLIEKIIKQRVQARVPVVEMRMEEQMQRLEKRMEGRMKTRIDVINEKIDKMNSMLAMLLSRELSGHENRENEI
jgi:hypothetical protein